MCSLRISLVLMALSAAGLPAASINPSTFASAPTGSTMPDSVVYGNGSLWIAYTNGAASNGTGGSASTVAQYALSGSLLNTFSVPGYVDGLRIDPTGNIWALQNQDGNSTLTILNPATKTSTLYNYGSTYGNMGRGFDDVAFNNGQVYTSETNPSTGSDAILLQYTKFPPSSPDLAGILTSTFTGTNLATGKSATFTLTDPDSLVLMPTGDLALTGEGDQTIVFIHDPGTASQTQTFVQLKSATGALAGSPDDTVYNGSATSGTFYLADTKNNTIVSVAAAGLTPGSIFVDAGSVFGQVDPTTGIVTPLYTGGALHGAQFVASGAPSAIPEPGSITLLGAAGAFWFLRRRAVSVR